MISVDEIVAVVQQLPRQDLWRVRDEIERRCEEEWDRQMEEDAREGGPLNKLADKALADYAAGKCRPLR